MKKILITSLFLCSLSALNAQVHPKEPDFFTEKKPEMSNKGYIMQLDLDFNLDSKTMTLIDEYFEKKQEEFDFKFGITNVVNLPDKKEVTYSFYSNDPRTFVSVGLFLAFLQTQDK